MLIKFALQAASKFSSIKFYKMLTVGINIKIKDSICKNTSNSTLHTVHIICFSITLSLLLSLLFVSAPVLSSYFFHFLFFPTTKRVLIFSIFYFFQQRKGNTQAHRLILQSQLPVLYTVRLYKRFCPCGAEINYFKG